MTPTANRFAICLVAGIIIGTTACQSVSPTQDNSTKSPPREATLFVSPQFSAETSRITAPDGTATARANNIRVATATSSARLTLAALMPSRTPAPTKPPSASPTSTPTYSPTEYFVWATFSNEQLGISFEYPRWFDLEPFSLYGCSPEYSASPSGQFLDVGERIWVSREPFDQSKNTLAQYSDQEANKYKKDGETFVDSINWGFVDKVRAVTIEYHFGGLGRYGVETHFAQNNVLYSAFFSAGGTCDFIEPIHPGISEFAAYWHMLETWKFLR